MGRCNSFHILVKPTGPICNLDCKYCYYTEKEIYFPKEHSFRMSDSVLESYIKQYIASQDTQEIVFAWQGGGTNINGIRFLSEGYISSKKVCGR